MKLRYYLRGLGIGITVTAIIMSFTKKPEELTDAEIKIRAAKLGMVEKSVLADIAKDDKEIITDKNENLFVENVESENVEEVNNNGQDTEGAEDITENPEQDVENTEGTTENLGQDVENAEEIVENYIIILVESGNSSEVVSQRLFEAGLINSSVEYNRYLIENGYDKKLRSGNHEIPAGASEEEMAKILCGIN